MNHLGQQLHSLAAHVRDPSRHPGPPGIEPRRLKVYRELVFNNLEGLLAGGFPVIRNTLGAADWMALVRQFLIRHHCQTALFTELGGELVAFLDSDVGHDPARPWLAELAHYERAELVLQLRDAVLPAFDPTGDVLAGIPLLSPRVTALAYRWPVHRICRDFQPSTPPIEPSLILLRREDDGRVQFSHLSPLLYRLLDLATSNTQASGRMLLKQLANEAGHPDFDIFLAQAQPMLQRLHTDGVLLGTRIR